MRSRSLTLLRIGLWVATAALPLVAWWWATSTGRVSPLVLPRLGEVGTELLRLLGDHTTYEAFTLTLTSVAIASSVAVGAGVLIGAAGGSNRFLGQLFEPVLASASAVPIVMAYPLCIFILGIGSTSKIAFAALYAFFPVAVTTLHAVRNVDSAYIVMARSMGATRRHIAQKVMLPAAFPAVRVGIGLAVVLAYLAVVAGEMLTSRDGAGNRLVAALDTYRTAEGYAWICLVVAVPMLARALVWCLARTNLHRRGRYVDVERYVSQPSSNPAVRSQIAPA